MAEPTPDSPVPPKPPEAAKVQPKKETVRIALPPKPTAAPTIKLPSLPPTGASPAVAPGTAAPARPASAPAPAPTTQIPRPASAAPATAPAAATAARPGTAVSRPPAPAPAKAPMPSPAAKAPAATRTVGSVDTVLAVVAMAVGIIALLSVLFLVMGPFESGPFGAVK